MNQMEKGTLELLRRHSHVKSRTFIRVEIETSNARHLANLQLCPSKSANEGLGTIQIKMLDDLSFFRCYCENCQGQLSHFKDTIATHINLFGHMHGLGHDVFEDETNTIESTVSMPLPMSNFDTLTSTRTAAPSPAPIQLDAEDSPTPSLTNFNESDFFVNYDDDDDSDYEPDNDDNGSNSSSSESWSSDSSSLSQPEQPSVYSAHESNEAWDQAESIAGDYYY